MRYVIEVFQGNSARGDALAFEGTEFDARQKAVEIAEASSPIRVSVRTEAYVEVYRLERKV